MIEQHSNGTRPSGATPPHTHTEIAARVRARFGAAADLDQLSRDNAICFLTDVIERAGSDEVAQLLALVDRYGLADVMLWAGHIITTRQEAR